MTDPANKKRKCLAGVIGFPQHFNFIREKLMKSKHALVGVWAFGAWSNVEIHTLLFICPFTPARPEPRQMELIRYTLE